MKTKEELLLLANLNDANAMVQLGNIYFQEMNFEKALHWFKKSVEFGNLEAIHSVANTYEQLDIQHAAKKMPKHCDYVIYQFSDESIYWYKKSLENYEHNKKDHLEYAVLGAELLSDSDAIVADYDQAFELYYYVSTQQPLNSDDQKWISLAQLRLAKMYELGLGCEINLENSKLFFEKSGYSKEKYDLVTFA